MENLIQSDIFFFITSIAVIVVTIFILIILWYVVRILKNVKDVSDIIKKESFFVLNDLSGLRERIKGLLQSLVVKCNKSTNKTTRKKTATPQARGKIVKEKK